MDQSRRELLTGAAAFAGGLLLVSVRPADATPASMQAAIRNVLGDVEIGKGKVSLDIAPLVENGNAVPMVVAVESPMTATNYVKAIHVFNEKNPQPNVISIHLGAASRKGQHLDTDPPWPTPSASSRSRK